MFQLKTHLLSALIATQAVAYPGVRVQKRQSSTTGAAAASITVVPYNWSEGGNPGFVIHHSCNDTERAQLTYAFDETVKLAQHAKDHILRHGASSDFYQTYFGEAKTGEPIGWYEKVIIGDKGEMLFRCDDVDKRCSEPERAGYNREETHLEEAITCPYSYETRRPLTQLCAFGNQIAKMEDNTIYFASDILHRIFHMPGFGEKETLDHYADGWVNATLLAKEDPAKAVRNSATLRLFALDVYAYDINAPGVGCSGDEDIVVPSATSTAGASATSAASAPTTSVPPGCHTHENEEVHCDDIVVPVASTTAAAAASVTSSAPPITLPHPRRW